MLSSSLVSSSHRSDQSTQGEAASVQCRTAQSLPPADWHAVPDAHRAARTSPGAPGSSRPRLPGRAPRPCAAFPSQGGRSLSPHGSGTPCPPPDRRTRRRTRLKALSSASPSSAPPPWPRSRRPQRTQRRAPGCACAATAPAGRAAAVRVRRGRCGAGCEGRRRLVRQKTP